MSDTDGLLFCTRCCVRALHLHGINRFSAGMPCAVKHLHHGHVCPSQLRLVSAIPSYSVCAAAFLGIGAKHLFTSGRLRLAALDTVATFMLTLPLPLYMHTFTEVSGQLHPFLL